MPIRILSAQSLSDDDNLPKKTTFEVQRRDGSWQRSKRESDDQGNGAHRH